MNVDKVLDIFGGILLIALTATVVRNAKGTAQVTSSFFGGFANTIRAAQGR